MRIDDIKYVLAIAEYRSFSKVASMFHISQPALSQRVQSLEAEIGCELFIREKKNVRLTPEGELFISEGQKILHIYDHLLNSINSKSKKTGLITVSASAIYSKYYFPNVFAEFLKRHPNIELQLIEAQSRERLRMLHDKEIDFAIVKACQDKRIKQIDLFCEQVVFVVPQAILQRNTSSIYEMNGQFYADIRGFANECFLGYSKDNVMSDVMRGMCVDAGFIPNVVFKTADPEVIHVLAACGMGVGFLPNISRINTSNNDKASYFLVESNYANRPYVVAHNAEVMLSKECKEFVEVLQSVHSQMESEEVIDKQRLV